MLCSPRKPSQPNQVLDGLRASSSSCCPRLSSRRSNSPVCLWFFTQSSSLTDHHHRETEFGHPTSYSWQFAATDVQLAIIAVAITHPRQEMTRFIDWACLVWQDGSYFRLQNFDHFESCHTFVKTRTSLPSCATSIQEHLLFTRHSDRAFWLTIESWVPPNGSNDLRAPTQICQISFCTCKQFRDLQNKNIVPPLSSRWTSPLYIVSRAHYESHTAVNIGTLARLWIITHCLSLRTCFRRRVVRSFLGSNSVNLSARSR